MDDEEDLDLDRFISGIYNYCDRWCERCAFRAKCYVWHQEREMFERHLLRGEDPDDPDVVMADVSASFEKTFKLLLKMAEEMGVDLSDAPPSPARRRRERRDEHPLFQRTMEWSDRLDDFGKRVSEEMPAAAQSVVSAFERGELTDELLAMGRLQGASDDIELLMRYRFLIPAKVGRMVSREDDEELNEIVEEATRSDALGTAKLVDECLTKTAAALWRLGEFEPAWLEQAMLCAGGAESLRTEVRVAFPGLEAFKRPGLDEA